MIDLIPPNPEVVEAGEKSQYELELIQRVVEGDWLGERMNPTGGDPGIDVCGRYIPSKPGVAYPLRYEKSSVSEEMQSGKTILRARKSGAVFYRGDMVGVYNYMELTGNVDYSTGNIDYNGAVTVKGTVEDHFKIAADRDIEILGEYGVGGAEEIVSRDGSIYIRGGIAGKGRAVIRCRKNLYVKFLSDVTVECEGNVYIGFYAMNSKIKARQIFVDSPRGKIVGGQVEAVIRVEVAEIGNRGETATHIVIDGFHRQTLITSFEAAVREMEEGKREMSRLKQKIRLYDIGDDKKLQDEQIALREQIEELKDRLRDVEYEYKSLADHLRTPGEGAVIVKKHCYPNVHIQIKNAVEEVLADKSLCRFVYRDGNMIIE